MKIKNTALSVSLLAIFACQKEGHSNTVKSASENNPDSATVAAPKASTADENTEGDVKDQYVYITKIYQKNGKWFADVDYIQFLTGEKGLAEAKKRGLAERETDENGREHYFLPNDYTILNDNTKIRTFEIEPSAEIFTYDFKNAGSINPDKTPRTSIPTLAKNREDSYPYLMDVKNGKITLIKQIFIP